MTDQEMIEGIIRQDRTALRFLVNKYQRQVIKTAYYFLNDMAEAEDLSQDIFMEIIRSIGKFRKTAAFSTWVYRITANRSLNRIKRNKRNDMFIRIESLFHRPGSATNDTDAVSAATSDQNEDRENRELLNKAIADLPENQRIAFVMNKYEALSCKEVSEIMEMSQSSVESLIHRAKQNLQKKLVRHFPEYAKT
jgi:RNA polymerase sigma-70 factor (ECF subfamily)